jgi:hypothetical protein
MSKRLRHCPWATLPQPPTEYGGSCERTSMKSTSESLSHPETSNGKAAGGNCIVARRGGEQPEADLRSQTRVNPIRFATTASLRASGEACRMSGNRFLPDPSYTGEKRAVVDGWGEHAGKVSCGRLYLNAARPVAPIPLPLQIQIRAEQEDSRVLERVDAGG